MSAGSYKDLTRVAYLNENMWTELFLENKDNLIFELDNIINELQKY
ncbi:MAG: prephenate dehydrogenase/arogenate dehydrogenase family protein, partial [Clostridia bacterium]|nr:prephenate dehydrogenase/arogenate dehydrogenase family protein [Clostridia bacterium]